MKCFVTGASGFIGHELVKALLKDGHDVNAIIRSPDKFELSQGNLHVYKGDLHSTAVIDDAMKGCEAVFHLAAYANIWSRDKSLAHRTNVIGTQNILEAALKHGIKKVVFTSSAATLPPSAKKEIVDESFPVPEVYGTEYETTKREAELLCIDFVKKGLDVVIVNPSRLYGPGFLNKSNSVTLMIKKYLNGSWRLIPGDGDQLGNYVFVEDVVNGHLLALAKGKPGERYILGGENATFNDFFDTLAKVSGRKHRMFHIPLWLMMVVAQFEFTMAEAFGKKPLITPPWVRRYNQQRPISSQKATRELGYSPLKLEEGIQKTIDWLNSQINDKNKS